MRNAATEKILSKVSSTGVSLSDDAFAQHLDEEDPLRAHRSSFHFPKLRDGTPCTYLSGNSLGLQHVGVESAIQQYLKKWREQGSEGQFMQPNPWFETENALRKDMASLVGAGESEVVLMNSLTVNIHLMMCAFFKPTGTRCKILMQSHGFSSVTQSLSSQLEMHGLVPADNIIVVNTNPQDNWRSTPTAVSTDAFLSAIEKRGDEIAIVMIPAVHFLTGQFFDIEAITKAAHAKGILVGVDCAHAVGNVPLKLHSWDVDFACWCTYKYLNSGPGNIGGAFVHSRLTMHGSQVHCLKGWWGTDRTSRLSTQPTFDAAPGAEMFQISNAAVGGMAALAPSLKLMSSIGMDALREKSLHLTAYLELLLNELVPPGCLEIITPVDPAQRGSQLSVRILPNKLQCGGSDTQGYECSMEADGADDAAVLQRRLLDEGVMVVSKYPDIVRLAPVPLYNSFTDVLVTVRAISSLF